MITLTVNKTKLGRLCAVSIRLPSASLRFDSQNRVCFAPIGFVPRAGAQVPSPQKQYLVCTFSQLYKLATQ